MTIFFYLLTFFSKTGDYSSSRDKQEFEDLINKKPDLFNPNSNCPACKTPKVARSQHCPYCNL